MNTTAVQGQVARLHAEAVAHLSARPVPPCAECGTPMTHAEGYEAGPASKDIFTEGAPEERHAPLARRLQERIERLARENTELAEKARRESDRATALYVDADRREQRALALLPDCEAHRGELQYLRHCVSWYWHTMNDAEEARGAIVMSLMLNAQRAREAGPDATVKAADVADWLDKAVARQDKPLRRTSFPTLADCLRSAHGGCSHDSVCGDVIIDVLHALDLAPADRPAPCKPAKAGRR
jgi:hypothetical protein